MANSDASQHDAAERRARAEALWRQKPAHSGDALPDETARLLHELEIHQIQLEMQNDELRQAQEELATSHARYFDLFDLAPVGYLTLDENGMILEANLAAAGLLAIDRSRLVRQPLTGFIYRDDQDIYYLHRKRHSGTQRAEECELRLKRRDGSVCWVRMQTALAQDSAGAQLSRVTLSDITERRRAEEQIRFQAGLLQAVEQAVIVSDLHMVVIYWNRYAEKLYGWTVKEALGRGLHELIMQQVTEEQAKALVSSLQAGRSWSGDMAATRKNGESFSAFFEFSPVQDQQGKLVGAIGVSRDNTQARQIEEDMRVSHQQLKDLSRRLVSLQESEREYVAHRLYDDESQRLAAVLLGLGMMEREADGSPAVVARITELRLVVDGLMRDLHGLAINLRPASLDQLGLMAALRQSAEELAEKHDPGIQIEISGLREVRLPTAVETIIFRIAQEALANAFRHSRAKTIDIVATHRGEWLVLVIEDNGEGFDVEDALRCGRLGLVGMRERAEMLGGRLSIESTPGKGTAVYVEVPTRPVSAS